MNVKLPALLQDSINRNAPDVDVITKHLKLPWIKLDLKFPALSGNYINNKHQESINWRHKWNYDTENALGYQVNGWNGNLLFGPADLLSFTQEIDQDPKWRNGQYDEGCRCRMFRHQFDYTWTVDKDDPIRQWVSNLFDNQDLNLVNTYFLPAGGYVFPHRDYAIDNTALSKLYIAIQWSSGNVLGMYGVGNMPIVEGDVFLLNNYTLPHWVYNGSTNLRMVLDVNANFTSTKIKEIIFNSFKKLYGIQ